MIGALIGGVVSGIGAIAGGSSQASGAAAAARESKEATKLQIAAAERARDEGVAAATTGNKAAASRLKEGIADETNIAAKAARGAAGTRSSASKKGQGVLEAGLKDAGKFSLRSLVDSDKELRNAYKSSRDMLADWRKAGEGAIKYLDAGLESGRFSMDSFKFQEDPGYQFRKKEGEEAINRGNAARGNFLSGNALRDLSEFNSGLAADEYGRAWQRGLTSRQQDYNVATGIADRGYDAAVRTADMRTRLGDNLSASDLARGDIRAGLARDLGTVRAGGIVERGEIGAQRDEIIGGLRSSEAMRTAQADAQSDLNIAAAAQQGATIVGDTSVNANANQGNILSQLALQRGQAGAQGWQGVAGAANQGIENFIAADLYEKALS